MSDDNKTVMLSFSVGDLPMLARAMNIAAVTAMMCGNKVAQGRLDRYKKAFADLIPQPAKLFETEHWAEIIIALGECKEWSLGIGHPEWDRHGHYASAGRIRVRVDDETWLSDYYKGTFNTGSPELQTVRELLEQFAHMDAQLVDA